MLSSLAEWAVAVVAAGLVAGLVLVAAAVAGFWWLRRKIRRKVDSFIGVMTARPVRVSAEPGGVDATFAPSLLVATPPGPGSRWTG